MMGKRRIQEQLKLVAKKSFVLQDSELCLLKKSTFLPLLVEKISSSGAKLVLISNSSKRAQVTINKLPSLGFDPNLFTAIVTSGELTFQYLNE